MAVRVGAACARVRACVHEVCVRVRARVRVCVGVCVRVRACARVRCGEQFKDLLRSSTSASPHARRRSVPILL